MLQMPRTVSRALLLALLGWSAGALTACKCDSHGCADAITAEPSIQLTASNLAPEIVPGGSIQITVVGTFAGGPTSATLGNGPLPTGVAASFSPTTVAAGAPSTLTLSADSTAKPGLFLFSVVATETGSNFGISASTDLTGNVRAPFTISASGASATVGTSQAFTIGVTRAAGFNAPVGMSIDSSTMPVGTGVVFSPPTATGSSTQLTLDIPATAATVPWPLRVIGKFGASRDTATFTMTLQAAPVPPDITLTAAPATYTVAPGMTATVDLVTTRNLGTLGMGNIILSVSGAPPGATATLTPSNVATATSQLVLTTNTSVNDGSYPITVTATLGTLVRTAVVTLVVATPPDFTLSVAPAALSVARNASGQATLTLQRTGPVTGIAVDAVSLPTGVTFAASPALATGQTSALTFTVGATASAGTYPIVIRGTAGALVRTTTLSLTVPAPPPNNLTLELLTPNVSVPVGGTVKIPIRLTRTGTAIGQLIELRLAGIPIGGTAWIAPSFTTADTATLNVIAGGAGVATIAVSAVLGAFPPTDVATVTVTPSTTPDFAISPAPTTLNTSAGMYSSPMAVQIWRSNTFTGPVSFQATGDIAGQYLFRFSLTQTTGSAVGLEIYASPSVPEGPHVITLRGTSGSTVREVTMTVYITAAPMYPYPSYPYGIKRPPP